MSESESGEKCDLKMSREGGADALYRGICVSQQYRMIQDRSTPSINGTSGQIGELSPRRIPSNENKMSDGWRDSASLRIEGGISSQVRNESCQPFAPSHG
jgi:hypothetical protein